jgi:hypothetical protein
LSNSPFSGGATERAFIVTSRIRMQDRHDRHRTPIMSNGRLIYRPSIDCESRANAQLGFIETRVIHRYWVTLVFSDFQLALALAV